MAPSTSTVSGVDLQVAGIHLMLPALTLFCLARCKCLLARCASNDRMCVLTPPLHIAVLSRHLLGGHDMYNNRLR
jgi:hypothetical protein